MRTRPDSTPPVLFLSASSAPSSEPLQWFHHLNVVRVRLFPLVAPNEASVSAPGGSVGVFSLFFLARSWDHWEFDAEKPSWSWKVVGVTKRVTNPEGQKLESWKKTQNPSPWRREEVDSGAGTFVICGYFVYMGLGPKTLS